jgi:hypothetical protein
MARLSADAQRRRGDLSLTGRETLRWRHLTSQEKGQTLRLLSEKTLNTRAKLRELAEKTRSSDVNRSERLAQAAEHPDVVEERVDIDQYAERLADRMERAATGPERLPGEPYSGAGFYYQQRNRLVSALHRVPSNEEVFNLTKASSLLSNRLSPEREARTASALMDAHLKDAVIHFSPQVVRAMATGYTKETAGKKQMFVSMDGRHLAGQTIPVKYLDAPTLNFLRHRKFGGENSGLIEKNSEGVDWNAMRSAPMGPGFIRAHRLLQGDVELLPRPFADPKRFGYSESTYSADPEHEEEFAALGHHFRRAVMGEISPHEAAAWQSQHHGLFNLAHPMAADMWHRAATSGQQLDIASTVAGMFVTNKKAPARLSPRGLPMGERTTIANRDKRINPDSLEHVVQQEATERASKILQARHGIAVPPVMIQEGVWAQIRREAGEDPEFNRLVNSKQFTRVA